jgi:thiamine monophosphate synthase
MVLEAGADTIVVGSSIFGADDIAAAASEIKGILESSAGVSEA